jgi:hypothetical protein
MYKILSLILYNIYTRYMIAGTGEGANQASVPILFRLKKNKIEKRMEIYQVLIPKDCGGSLRCHLCFSIQTHSSWQRNFLLTTISSLALQPLLPHVRLELGALSALTS